VAYSAVDAQAVLDKMEAAGNGANIMILDACRNNPFTRGTRSGQAGLAQMDAPVGTLVAFATSPGAVASDGAGSNGLYTQHLLEAMRKEGSKVEDVFKQVRANVRRDSLGKQVPWEATSLEGDFYFRGGASAGTQRLDLEQALWDAVKDSKEPIELRAYLNRYPKGKFSQLARERLSAGSTVNQTTSQPTNATIRPPVAVVATDSKTDNNQRTKEAVDQPFNLPPSHTTSQRPASSSTTDDLQAAVDQRTKELLDQLSNLPRPNAASIKPSAATNANGFTVGDRWRFQTVDIYKKEVVENWVRQIERIEPDGSMRLNSGRVQWSPTGGLQRIDSASGRSRTYSPEIPYLPSQLQNGWQQAVKFTLTWRNEDNQHGLEQREGKLSVLGRESVTVPAGTFDAWKVEMTGDAKGRNLVNNSNYYRTFKEVWWYVPALRYFVASEYEQRGSGQLETYVRHELTSYSVRGAEEALAKR
jgi:Caspase domain